MGAILAESGVTAVQCDSLSSWAPGRDGVSVVVELADTTDLADIRSFRDEHPHTPLVAVVGSIDVATVARLFRAGASAAVSHDVDADELARVLLLTRDGTTVLPLAVAQSMAQLVPDEHDLPSWIGTEETLWLRAMAGGETVSDVAEWAGYSERAMFRQLRALYQRLGVHNRTEALLWAKQRGLLD